MKPMEFLEDFSEAFLWDFIGMLKLDSCIYKLSCWWHTFPKKSTIISIENVLNNSE